MAAVLASTEVDHSDDVRICEKIISSSINGFPRSEDREDASSEDSGTGCRQRSQSCSRQQSSRDTNSPGHQPSQHVVGWDEIGGVYIDRSTGDVVDHVNSSRRVGEEVMTREELGAATDRDSGHGSEAKSHSGGLACDSANSPCDTDCNTEGNSVTPCYERFRQNQDDTFILPPPPPSPPPLSYDYTLVSSPPTTHHIRNYRSRGRLASYETHSDLPPPPPSPTLTAQHNHLPPPPLPSDPSQLPSVPSTLLAAVSSPPLSLDTSLHTTIPSTLDTAQLNMATSEGIKSSSDSGSSEYSSSQAAVAFSQCPPLSQYPTHSSHTSQYPTNLSQTSQYPTHSSQTSHIA